MALSPLLSLGGAAASPSSHADHGTNHPGHGAGHGHRHGHDRSVRFATFNASLNRLAPGQLVEDLSTPDNQQARNVAETIQRAAPDVVLVNEFDYDPEAVDLFRENYLEVSQNGARPARYRYAYVAPSNTGVPSGFDLDNDGTVGGGNDALGFGEFEGQYGMVVYSKYPIDTRRARTFQHFLWKDMPGARLPDDASTPAAADFYSGEELAVLPLSSKSHWDLPIKVRGRTIHFLVAHPTPPVFDGPEDRNGMRNADEIRFWGDYVSGGRRASYIRDDRGRRGGLDRHAQFVIAGDLNSDPRDGDSLAGATDQLLDNRRVNTSRTPTSDGAVEASELQGGANQSHVSDPAHDTADFADSTPGNIRADYVLPSRGLRILDSEVFWKTSTDPLYRLTGAYPFPTSDHRLVWVDVRR
ncbi:endonuclease [Nocardioides sp. Soil797]|nr:endonuclease [Nocardioides sp. Soil797]